MSYLEEDVSSDTRALLTGFGVSAATTFVLVSGTLGMMHAVSVHALPLETAQAAVQSEQAAEAVDSDATQDASLDEAGSTADDGGQAEALDEAGDTQEKAQASREAADSSALAMRDKDFAVDPARTDWNFETNGKKTVYLTIDDGPSANTQEVLDILDRYGCKATFFVVGHNDDYFPMIAEAYKRGHTIGLHTYTHDYAQVYASTDAFFNELDAIGQVVKDQIGYVPCFIRFPGGSSNEISADYCEGIMSELAGEVQARGYQYYDWNLSVGDGAEHTADEIVGYGTEPIGEDAIMLLCHDSATKQTTVEALPSIIEHYQKLGYTFEALDRTSWVCHHDINN